MPIHWKRLCSLGILFWAGMSAYDYYHGSILIPGEFDKSAPEELLPDVQDQPKIASSFKIDHAREPSGWSFWIYAFAYLSVSTFFTIVYLAYKYYSKRIAPSNEIISTNNAIRAALFDSGFDNLEHRAENILIINDNKYEMCASCHCKDREEDVVESPSSKEIASLNKKLDSLNEEKRNLTRFLAQSEKDNRIIKQKMMEVLRDKNVLLKRLEAATREIRSNTVARQATLDKLEESIHCSNQLKQQIQHMSTEKSELLRRLRQLEGQCKTLRRQNKSVNTLSNNGIKIPSTPKSIDSSRDIEQIEMKLHDLEASLEKMKSKNSDKSDEFESEDNDDTTSDSTEPKILRQVSSTDMNFLSEVEPSYTNLLAKFDCEPGGGGQLHHQIVESIAPAVAPCYKQHKFAVTNTFGSALFNILKLIQNQHSECINGMVRPLEPVAVNYAVVCNYKCPYAEKLAMLGCNYFGINLGKKKIDEKSKRRGTSQEIVKYNSLPKSDI